MPSKKMIEAGFKVLEESGLTEYDRLPGSAELTIAEIYEVMQAAGQKERDSRCKHKWKDVAPPRIHVTERECAKCRIREITYAEATNPVL